MDVTGRKIRCGGDCLVGDGDLVVGLVPVAQTLKDLDGQGDRGLVYLDRLEATLQGGVLLDVLTVLVEGCRTDSLQLAASQHRLEHAGSVDCPFSGTGADKGVDLVDEQDDVPAIFYLLEDLLHPLLEITAVTRSRNHGAKVQGVNLLVTQSLGNVSTHDGLSQALDTSRLTDARLTNKNRVILGAPAQHHHDSFDFPLTPDNRVELAVAGGLGKVATELVKNRRRGLLRSGLGGAGSGGLTLVALISLQQLQDAIAHRIEVSTQPDQYLSSDAFSLPDKAKQNVLGANVRMIHLEGFAQAQLKNLLGTRGKGNMARRRRSAVTNNLLHLGANSLQ